jgi:hypothetical protein
LYQLKIYAQSQARPFSRGPFPGPFPYNSAAVIEALSIYKAHNKEILPSASVKKSPFSKIDRLTGLTPMLLAPMLLILKIIALY